ncbi:lactonase family protein [Tessaracoccus sp. HDW20]|uniref:lactonase family protein n=1 Tax=Tessaracoccus coleopterorum TaxID=2714950 RepID=UPI0018D33C9D|nr:lactonase family protein [Tessaracoccus coleopterorum]
MLDRESGGLTELTRMAVSDTLAYLALTPHALLGASYHGGWGASWSVTDGVIGSEVSRFRHRNVHAAVPDAHGGNAYFPALGDDVVAQFALAVDGELVELSEPAVKVTPGSGPRHLVVSGNGRNAYLLNEFTAQVMRFDRSEGGRLHLAEDVRAYDTASGLHDSGYGKDPRAGHLIWAADLAFADDERWLLCSERSESTVAAVRLDADGRLTEHVVLSKVEAQPRGITVAPDGRHVVVVGSCQATPGCTASRTGRSSSSTGSRPERAPTGCVSSDSSCSSRRVPKGVTS